jgi:lipopolysaccharide transport system permease protein
MHRDSNTTFEVSVREDEGQRASRLRPYICFDFHLVAHLRRLWKDRFLVFALTVRGIRARYKQSLLGVGWALLTPLAMTAVTYYMYRALGLESKVFPCPRIIYLLFMMTFWTFTTRAITNGSTSLVSNLDLVTKIYFPREVLPIASVLTNLVDLGLSFATWTIMAAIISFMNPSLAISYPRVYPFIPHIGWLWIPVLLTIHILFILGLVFIASTLQVYFRDIGHLVSLGTLLWLIITPVMYPLGAFAGGRYTMLININPMTGILDGYRLAVISRASPWVTAGNWEHHVIGAAIFSVFIFLVGYSFFKHEERYIADVV